MGQNYKLHFMYVHIIDKMLIMLIIIIIIITITIIIIIIIIIVSITKFSIVIGSPCAYLSHNRHTITWVSDYRCQI